MFLAQVRTKNENGTWGDWLPHSVYATEQEVQEVCFEDVIDSQTWKYIKLSNQTLVKDLQAAQAVIEESQMTNILEHNHPLVGASYETAKFILSQMGCDDLRVLEQRASKRGGLIGEQILKSIVDLLGEDKK